MVMLLLLWKIYKGEVLPRIFPQVSTQIKLSSFYFFYFTVFGVFVPYAGLYYDFLGFNAIQIGQLSAIFVATKLIAPNLLGWIADKTELKVFWVKWSAFVTFILLIFFARQSSFEWMLLAVFIFSFFFHSSLPIFESYTFNTIKKAKQDKSCYGRIRLWGSVGFVFAVVIVGWVFDKTGMASFPFYLLIFAFLIWLAVVFLAEEKTIVENVDSSKFWKIIKQPQVIALLLVSLLIQFSHGSYYGFYSIFLSDAGYSKTSISIFWAVGVVAEIVVFLYMLPLFKKFSAKSLLIISLWLTVLRWLVIPIGIDSISILFIAQLLHAASYGLFHASAIYLIDHLFTGKTQSRGQAIYASLSHGLGGSLGLLLAGYVWFNYGAEYPFFFNAVIVVFSLFIAYKWIKI